jgi:hypothetical protein
MPSKNPSSPPDDSAAFPLELTCFGPPWARLRDRPSPPELHWRKHLAFLVYLALSPNRTRSRQHLLGVLWPDNDEQQARRSLNEAVRRLRCCLGGGGSSQRSARRGRTALVRGGLHARIIRTVQRRQIRAGGVAAGGEHGHRGDDDETTDWHRAPSWKCVQLEWVQLGALLYRVWRTRETTVSCCRSIAQPAWRAPAAAAASARATRIRAR